MAKKLLLSIVLAVFLSACKKDANDQIDYKTQIVGRWFFTGQQYNNYVNAKLTSQNDAPSSSIDKSSNIQFYADGKFTNGDSNNPAKEKGNYAIGRDSLYLILDLDNSEVKFKIGKLTSTGLTIQRTNITGPNTALEIVNNYVLKP